MSLLSFTGLPGMNTAVQSTESAILWGPNTWYLTKDIVLTSGATDSTNTPTTDLRPGLVLGKVDSSGEYTAYSASATDGSQIAEGVLFHGVRMLDPLSGSAADQLARMVVAGAVKGGNLIGLDSVARSQMRGRVIFDDDIVGGQWPFRQEVAKTSAYTVGSTTSALLESGTLFTNTGAVGSVTFTLPTRAAGLVYHFLVVADQTVIVASAAGDDMVTVNDAAADSVAFSTAGDKIGGFVTVSCNAAATKWYVEKRCSNAMTIAT